MTTIEIIDAHIHYWNPYTTPRSVSSAVKVLGRFPWLLDRAIKLAIPKETINYFGKTTLFTNPYLPKTHFEDIGQFDLKGVVHIQADWQAKTPLAYADETAWLDSLERPPLAIVGDARLHDLENLPAVLDAHQKASSRFRGIRDMLAHHASSTVHKFNDRRDRMQTEAFRKGFAMLGERGLTFDAFIFSDQLPDLCDLVEAIPSTSVVLDHVGTPVGMMGDFCGVGSTDAERQGIQEEWKAGMQRLAQSEHVRVKLSGLFMHALGWDEHTFPKNPTVSQVLDMIGSTLQFVLDTFGAERCMFATNFPPDLDLMNFQTLYQAYFELVKELPESDQQRLFSGTAREFYSIS